MITPAQQSILDQQSQQITLLTQQAQILLLSRKATEIQSNQETETWKDEFGLEDRDLRPEPLDPQEFNQVEPAQPSATQVDPNFKPLEQTEEQIAIAEAGRRVQASGMTPRELAETEVYGSPKEGAGPAISKATYNVKQYAPTTIAGEVIAGRMPLESQGAEYFHWKSKIEEALASGANRRESERKELDRQSELPFTTAEPSATSVRDPDNLTAEQLGAVGKQKILDVQNGVINLYEKIKNIPWTKTGREMAAGLIKDAPELLMGFGVLKKFQAIPKLAKDAVRLEKMMANLKPAEKRALTLFSNEGFAGIQTKNMGAARTIAKAAEFPGAKAAGTVANIATEGAILTAPEALREGELPTAGEYAGAAGLASAGRVASRVFGRRPRPAKSRSSRETQYKSWEKKSIASEEIPKEPNLGMDKRNRISPDPYKKREATDVLDDAKSWTVMEENPKTKPIVDVLAKSRNYNAKIKFTGENNLKYFSREELDAAKYPTLKPGKYQVWGYHERTDQSGRKAVVGSGVHNGEIRTDKAALIHESIHEGQSSLRELDSRLPGHQWADLSKRLGEWETSVRSEAKNLDINIPEGEELLSDAMVMQHFGYARGDTELQRVFMIPKDLGDDFLNYLTDGGDASAFYASSPKDVTIIIDGPTAPPPPVKSKSTLTFRKAGEITKYLTKKFKRPSTEQEMVDFYHSGQKIPEPVKRKGTALHKRLQSGHDKKLIGEHLVTGDEFSVSIPARDLPKKFTLDGDSYLRGRTLDGDVKIKYTSHGKSWSWNVKPSDRVHVDPEVIESMRPKGDDSPYSLRESDSKTQAYYDSIKNQKDLFEGTANKDKRAPARRALEAVQRQRDLKRQKADKGGEDLPLFEKKAPNDDQQSLFSLREPEKHLEVKKQSGPEFYSKLNKVITDKMPERSDPQTIANIIKKGGVKTEEVLWSGLDDFLKGKKTVSKGETLKFLKENEVKIKDVTHSSVRDSKYGARDVKYSKYTLPGGVKYKETLLTLPKKTGGNDFYSNHFGEKNILAHIRSNERKTNQGERVLFVEEIQSDWHQKGRDAGYEGEMKARTKAVPWKKKYGVYHDGQHTRGRHETIELAQERINNYWFHQDAIKEGKKVTIKELPEEKQGPTVFRIIDKETGEPLPGDFSVSETVEDAYRVAKRWKATVPEAPFKKNWHELALKWMLRYAAEKNLDRLAWTTGAQQIARYDLSKSVTKISYSEGNLRAYDLNGGEVINKTGVTKEQLPDYIGREPAIRLLEKQEPSGAYVLEGENLKAGGEGMNLFYDKKILQFLKKYTKKWGGELEDVEIEKIGKQPSIPITKEMKESVMTDGQPLFSLREPEKHLEVKKQSGPEFYSKLNKVITDKMPERSDPQTIANIIKKGGVKTEEVLWSGLDDFLKGKKTVSKGETLNFLKENEVKIETVNKSKTPVKYHPNEKPHDETIYGAYTLPGGKNYTESLLKLPIQRAPEGTSLDELLKPDSKQFKSSHWPDQNVFAHARTTDRKTPEGKKVLFLEEIQSDWHQKGRKEGYQIPGEITPDSRALQIDKLQDEYNEKSAEADRIWDNYKDNTEKPYPDELEILREDLDALTLDIQGLEREGPVQVPNAPFKKTWHELTLKKMLRLAAEKDFDYLSWTTGAQQADRYDLSKTVDWVKYDPHTEQLTAGKGAYGEQNYILSLDRFLSPHELEGAIGKDPAKKLLESTIDKEDYHVISGDNLSIGGSGMDGFYDKIVPQFLKKYAKKWNAKIEEIEIENIGKQLSVPITKEMKESVMTEGQPLFSLRKPESESDPEKLFPQDEITKRAEAYNKAAGIKRPTKKPKTAVVDLADYVSYKPGKGEEGSGYLTWKEKFYMHWVDEARPILKAQDIFEKEAKRPTTDDESIQFSVNRARGAAGSAKWFIERDLAPIYSGGKINKKFLKPLTPDQGRLLDEYLLAKHIAHLYANKKGFSDVGITENRAHSILYKIENGPEAKLMHERAQLMWDFHQKLAKMKTRNGVWTSGEGSKIAKYPYYVPLLRDFGKVKHITNRITKQRQAFTNTKKLARHITQATDYAVPLTSPLNATLADTHEAFAAIASGHVWNGVIDLVEKSPTLKSWIKEVSDDYEPMKNEGLVVVFRNGEKKYYSVPVEIEEAVQGLGTYVLPDYMKLLTKTATIFKRAVTSWNPFFSIANFTRDQQELALNAGMLPFVHAFKGLYHYIKKDKLYHDYYKHGGSMASPESGVRSSMGSADEIFYGGKRFAKFKDKTYWDRISQDWDQLKKYKGLDVNKLKKAFLKHKKKEKYSKKHGKLLTKANALRMIEAAKQTARYPFDVAEVIGEASEMMSRLGVFEWAQKKKGMTIPQAIHLSRQSTLDFLRMGSKMRPLNQIIPFLNPGVQGIDRGGRTAVEDPKKFGVRWTMYGLIPMGVLTMYNAQNPNYQSVPSREKDYYHIIMRSPTSQDYWKIAKGHWQKITISPIQLMMEHQLGTAHLDETDFFLSTVFGFAPIDHPSALLPPLAKIVFEQAANYELYWERDIVRQPGLPAAQQYNPNTAETLKTIGRALKISPAKLQHITQGFLGGTSNNVLLLADIALGAMGLQDFPEIRKDRLPLINRFYGKSEEWKSDLQQRQREIRGKVWDFKKARRTVGRQQEKGDEGAEKAYIEEGKRLEAEYNLITDAIKKNREFLLKLKKEKETAKRK